jgi:DNA-binding NtrC family response regulator
MDMATSPTEPAVGALIEELLRSTFFEQAARAVLGAALAAAERALAGSVFARSGRIVRGVVHLRPGDGYRGLVAMPGRNARLPVADAGEAHLTSTTAWRWVAETRQAVSIDVHVGRIELPGRADPEPLLQAHAAGGAAFQGGETHVDLIARDVTHLHVVPLRGLGGAVEGMLSLEVECRASIGKPFVWPECARELQLIADVAAPHLVALPVREATPREVDPLLPVIGASMAPLVQLLRTFAQQDEPVLLTGPTGAGKSRIARWCHAQSRRRDQLFEVVDLSAVPEELQIAELFGWKKGAFTGAIRDKQGYLARADGGTIFIDEIDNLSPRAQASLLRVLEERAYRVLGDDGRDVPADVRFIVGTNAGLQSAVRDKRFREDLYYRINVLPVKLPALRERADEIVRWATYMANRRHGADDGTGVSLARSAEARLIAHPWPGNLRQLDNIVRRAYAIASMAQGGGAAGPMVIDDEHVRRALAYEEQGEGRSLVEVLLGAATAFVHEARQRGTAALDLDWTEAFKGFVLGVATEQCGGNREEAFTLLGKEKLAKARNHHKVLRRELDRVDDLCRLLGDPSGPFAGLATRSEPDPGDDPSGVGV